MKMQFHTPPYLGKYYLLVLVSFSLFITGCSQSNGSNDSSRNDVTVTQAPESYKRNAVNTDEELTVKGETDIEGPLAFVRSQGSSTTDSQIDGIFSALESDNNERSVSAEEFVSSVDIDKVFDRGVILSKNGDVLEVKGGGERVSAKSYPFFFDKSANSWIVESDFKEAGPILCETDLVIEADEILQPLYSYEKIAFTKDVNIDVDSPFENAVVAKEGISFQKADIIGRVHSGGVITSTGNLKVTGTIESKKEMVVGGDLKVNYLDLVYKAAKIASYEHLETPRLVWSRLFKTLNNKNGVAVFIYVDNALVDEEKLKEIIKEGREDEYHFISLVVGAGENSGGVEQRIEGLIPVYKNELEIENILKEQGHTNLKVTESLNIGDNELFVTYENIGTFSVLGKFIGEANKENSLIKLTDKIREEIISNNED